MQITNKELKKRILTISYKKKLSHLGSVLTAVDIIDEIFKIKKPDEKFVLSSGHAALALYVVLEKYDNFGRTINRKLDAEDIFDHHGVHPDRCEDCHLDCSAGSLGHGIGIAVGMALADRSKNVYCLISDGECAEGSVTESMRIKREHKVDNLKVYLNYNGWAAYAPVKFNITTLANDINIKMTNVDYLPFLNQPTPQQAHYHVMSEEDYKLTMGILK